MNQQISTSSQDHTVGFMNSGSFELSQRVAGMFAKSTLVPKEYQSVVFDSKTGQMVKNEQALSNCVIALNMAHRVGADPLMVMQNLVVVHGRPTWSSQFLIATFNSCGKFSSLRYEFFGEKDTDSYGCRATAIERDTGEKLIGTDVTIAIAKAEGWHGKNGSKWKTMPQQMLQYRAAAWFIRTIAPELSMGLHTQDEIIDIEAIDVTPIRETVDPKEAKEKPKSRSVEDLVGYNPEPTYYQPESAPPVEPEFVDATPPDPYAAWIVKIESCQTIGDIAALLNEMPANVKADLKELISNRQDEIKQA